MLDETTPEEYLDQCTTIESFTIEEEFIRTPRDLAYWNQQYSDAFLDWKKKKLKREQLWHSLYKECGDVLRGESSGRVTVAEIEAAATTDDRYLDACTAEIVAESEKVRLGGVMETMRTKRDMLISLGAHMRQEMQQAITLRTPEHMAQT